MKIRCWCSRLIRTAAATDPDDPAYSVLTCPRHGAFTVPTAELHSAVRRRQGTFKANKPAGATDR